MAKIKHFLGNKQLNGPVNWQDLQVVMDWDSEKLDASISVDSLTFKGDDTKEVLEEISKGYFVATPYRIEVSKDNLPPIVFDGLLDYSEKTIISNSDVVTAKLQKKQGSDWLVEVADSFSFRFLASDDYSGSGKITSSDYFSVPYVINYVPDGVQILLLSIASYSITKELVETIRSVATQITDIINGVIPVTGVAAIVPVVAWDVGDIVAAVIKLAITVAYSIGITVAIIKLIEQVREQLAPIKRFHLGMPIKLMFQKCCEYLNLELKSILLDSLDVNSEKWVHIPRKNNIGGKPPTGAPKNFIEVGYPTNDDSVDTFGDLIRLYKEVFNADFQIKDGMFEFERSDFWKRNSSFVIPNTFSNQDDRRHETYANTDEVVSNYVILWSTDLQDQNTLDNQEGRTFQAVTRPKGNPSQELVTIKGLKEINVPLSMAVRKDKFTVIEEILKVFLQAADLLTGQLGKPNSLTANFSARVGSMHLSSHFLSRSKMVVMSGSSLALDQRSILAASKLWDKYHFIESFVTIQDPVTGLGVNNQQTVVEEQKIPFCFEDFVSLSNNNFCKTSEGKDAEIKRLEWNVEDDFATITYSVFEVYDSNLEINILK